MIEETILTSENNNDSCKKNEYDFDGIEIFNNKSCKLDKLNQMSKLKRKEKKTTRKRIKNVESLVKDNNNIFDYIEGNNTLPISTESTKQIPVYDRASLYEDYKIMIDGYSNKKRIAKPCVNCLIDKVLIYSEGIYACMKCGEVENCIIESEMNTYKDPMVEKPTFPYKRKNHFCEWTGINYCSLELILKRFANIINYNLI
jgi:hypothetical protein